MKRYGSRNSVLDPSTYNRNGVPVSERLPYDPFHYQRRETFVVDNIGGKHVPVVIADLSKLATITPADKAAADETNTKYAQGGVAVVNDLENDSFEKHIEDTLIAGDGLCNKKVVEIVVKEGRTG